ncbi:MAG: tRNA dihydrouridine(20/20a) synthase DusA [Burkholderiales bacterium]|nr:tRNA dihydrouridine(20/20a) synthase DusA [Burkholderiales bacterium]OJX03164.1 MAG: tRNA dihydrouridine(20/20a) synthase DusA [Burkholderiales bacterium 70-64]
MSPHRFCVAPMLDQTDRHCRYFHRQLSRHARLYTEMVTTGALVHGPRERLLAFDAAEHPVALQLGGSDPAELARAARLGEQAGYDEINLNCGCPSERVQRGAFGACLMAEPALVADCVRAMRDAVAVPVTVKHRIGLDRGEDYGFVRDFVGALAQAGCEVFIVHARNAWLQGLSPRENRTVPPLRYETVARLARDFPAARFVLNGGLRDHAAALAQLCHVDGVMLGRAAFDEPWLLAEVDPRYFGQPAPCATRESAVAAMGPYVRREVAAGAPVRVVVRPMTGLFNGLPGARHWRRALGDPALLARAGDRVLEAALEAMHRGASAAHTAGCL